MQTFDNTDDADDDDVDDVDGVGGKPEREKKLFKFNFPASGKYANMKQNFCVFLSHTIRS